LETRPRVRVVVNKAKAECRALRMSVSAWRCGRQPSCEMSASFGSVMTKAAIWRGLRSEQRRLASVVCPGIGVMVSLRVKLIGRHDRVTRASVRSGMLAKWFSMTRLETRTKESNTYASSRVENPDAQ